MCLNTFPAQARDFSLLKNIQTESGVHPFTFLNSQCSLIPSWYSSLGIMLTTHNCLAPRLKIAGALPLLPLYAFMPVQGQFMCENMVAVI
jgi:hypothetical protein